MCLSAWEGAKSGSCSSHTFFYFPMPHWETRSTATNMFLSFPCWQLRLLLMLTRMRKSRTLDVNMPQGLDSLGLRMKNFLWELLCALLFRLTGPPLIWTKRPDGVPWRFFVGMTSYQNTFFSLGQLQRSCWCKKRVQMDCSADPKCCMQHLLRDRLSQYFVTTLLDRSFQAKASP